MSDLRWLTDYNAWSAKGRLWGSIAGVVAFLFLLLIGWGWFWSLILALLVLVAVVWFTRDSSAGAEPWKASAPPPPFVATPAPAPVKPVVAPAAGEVAVDAAAAEAAASERVRAAARAAGEAARQMDAPVEAVRPAGLNAPRGGIADDLKRIKGVGPKLEGLLNSLGYYHFDQIGSWGAPEIFWVDSNLEGFTGRVTRDDWVAQARLLATGAATEFSGRVDRGEVYDD
jgi:NADH-quinone oxidoreductase subunit E